MNQKSLRITRIGASVCLGLMVLGSTRAAATDYDYFIDTVFSSSGVSSPSGSAPWVDAHFADDGPDTVLLTLSNIGLSVGEYVDLFFLNLNPSYDPTALDITYVSSSGAFTIPDQSGGTILTGVNSYMADGDGRYDVRFSFANSGTDSLRFNESDSVTYQITGISGLVSTDFQYGSQMGGGAGTWLAAAHILGIDNGSATGSVWAAPLTISYIPEPAAGTLLVLFGGLWGGRRTFRRLFKR